MNARTLYAAHLVGAIALVSFVVPVFDEIQFAPEAGTVSTKTLNEELKWKLETMVQRVNGQEVSQDLPDMVSELSRETVVVDTYVEMGAGRPALLKRRVETARGTVAGSIEAGGSMEGFEYELASPLEGEMLVFRWDADESEFDCSLEEGSGHGEALGRLREDMDLRGLLPPADNGEVSEGDEWEVDPAGLIDVLAQGGDFDRAPEELPECDYQMLEREDPLSAGLISLTEPEVEIADSDVRATWSETRGEGDARLAVIEIELAAELSVDPTERLLAVFDRVGLETGREDLEVDMSWEIEGEGRLVWDLAAGRCVSFQLESEVNIVVLMSWNQAGLEVEAEFEISGQHRLQAETE